jgi:hypothetical protein
MKKSELIKYLMMPVKDVPKHILEILDEYGLELLFEQFNGLEDDFSKHLAKRKCDIFPNEGLQLIKEFFKKFDDELKLILKQISISKKINDLNNLKAIMNKLKQPMANEILELEIKRHRPFLDDYINKIDDELKKIVKPPKQQKMTSYVWQNNPDKELPELYNLMINKYKLIAPETTYEEFIAVYTGQPIGEIETIKWHQENASELLYFIDRLEQTDNIVHNPKKTDYQKMTACFVKPDGKQFKANWKQIKQNISINLSPDKQKAIDDLVGNF